jgi:hypothetical protein
VFFRIWRPATGLVDAAAQLVWVILRDVSFPDAEARCENSHGRQRCLSQITPVWTIWAAFPPAARRNPQPVHRLCLVNY